MGGRNADAGDGPSDFDDDAIDDAWAEIVAELTSEDPAEPGDSGDSPVQLASGTEPRDRGPEPRDWGLEPPRPGVTSTGPRDTAPDDDADDDDDDERGYIPPDPGPILDGDPLLTLAWAGAVGAPVAILLLLLWPGAPQLLLQALGAVFLVSFSALIWRMPHRRDEDDQDPGAVV